jgi:hypothetical protein
MRLRVCVLMVSLVCLAALPSTAWAQNGTISGLVTDTTGGILPGVTVEAASPVLISGTVTAVSDSAGRYTVTNLRPGTYSVTFSLDGFNKLIREGLILSGDAALQVNAQMQVGALEQSITVTGESPLVDVQSVREQFVVTREMMDSLPGTTTFSGRAVLIPGVRNTGMGEGQYWPAAHGNTWRDAATMNDGARANTLIDDGQWQMGWEMNQAATAELAYDAGGAPAEVQTGGVLQNAIPKEGGNTFRGTFFTQFGHENLNASNQTPELQAVLGELNRNAYNYNINPGYGGPVMKDRLWFYGAYLQRDSKGWVAGSKFTGEGTPEQRARNGFPDAGTQGYNRGWAKSGLLRLTNQLSEKHRWRIGFERVNSTSPLSDVTRLQAPESSNRIPQPTGYHTQARWTSTLTSKLLLEASGALQFNKWRREQFEWNESKNAFNDLATGVSTGAFWITGNQPEYQKTFSASASYVTGSHNLKFGAQNRWGYFTLYNGPHPGDIRIHYTLGGAPFGLYVLATPLDGFKAEINHDIGLYAQDTWTVNKFTFNLGIRGDIFKNGNPPQVTPAGTFVPARDFPALPAADWKTVVPRLGIAYDLFGNGKTAIKGYVHRYVNQESTTLALAVNPMASFTWGARQDFRNWTDLDKNGSALNADGTAQLNEITQSNNKNFGTLADAAQMNVKDRPGQMEYNVGVQHELIARLSVGMSYYRRDYFNFWREDNVLQSSSDYIPFTYTGPADPRLNEFAGATQTLYNLSPAVFGQSQRVLRNVNDIGGAKNQRLYNGLEWTVQGRFGKGGFFGGSINYEKTQAGDCNVENQNSTIWCDSPRAWQTQFKANASYLIPKVDIVSSILLQGYPGPSRSANYTASAASIFQQTGIVLTSGTGITYNLWTPDTYFLPYQTKVDLRFMKRFSMGTTRIAPTVDIFNVLNANTTTSVNNTCCSTALNGWGAIQSVMQARQVRIGAQVDW